MTETIEAEKLFEALSIIDRGLGDLQRRELVSSAEVADLLLDVRTLLTFSADTSLPEPSGVV